MMVLSGTMIGLIGVLALLLASLTLALLDRREKDRGHPERSRLFSRLALGLFLAAFVGGVIVTLVGGIKPREETGPMRGAAPPPGRAGVIGEIDEKELKSLQEKVAADPSDVTARERLGHIYLQMQDYQGVFQMAHEALQVDPKSVESRVHMAMVLFVMGESESAMMQFDQALAVDPDNSEALRFKGMVEAQMGAKSPKD